MTGADDDADGPVQALTMRSRQAGPGVVWEVTGEVDLVTAPQFRAGVGQVLQNKPGVLVLDLTRLTFLGSVGLSVLVEANTAAGPGVLRVVTGNAAARRAIEVMGLAAVLTLCATVEDALRA